MARSANLEIVTAAVAADRPRKPRSFPRGSGGAANNAEPDTFRLES